METSLHRQLKEHYAGAGSQTEVNLGSYRIDAVAGEQLVEIQHGSLAAIRDKIAALLTHHAVLVVKPLVVRKYLVRQDGKRGAVVSRRLSPKRGGVLDLFDELVYFTRVFPHENLIVETPLVEIEELRYPGHGRRRRWRENDFQVEDQRLLAIETTHQFRWATDLLRVLPAALPAPFHSGHVAEGLGIPRWRAQKIVYCLRQTGAVIEAGKAGNTRLYLCQSKPKRHGKRRA